MRLDEFPGLPNGRVEIEPAHEERLPERARRAGREPRTARELAQREDQRRIGIADIPLRALPVVLRRRLDDG
jgi:hypothetical protein